MLRARIIGQEATWRTVICKSVFFTASASSPQGRNDLSTTGTGRPDSRILGEVQALTFMSVNGGAEAKSSSISAGFIWCDRSWILRS